MRKGRAMGGLSLKAPENLLTSTSESHNVAQDGPKLNPPAQAGARIGSLHPTCARQESRVAFFHTQQDQKGQKTGSRVT